MDSSPKYRSQDRSQAAAGLSQDGPAETIAAAAAVADGPSFLGPAAQQGQADINSTGHESGFTDESLQPGQRPGPKYLRLSTEEKTRILQYRQAGSGYREIARLLKRSESVVYRYLQPFESTKDQAIGLLRAASETAARSWIASLGPAAASGNHKPAKDLLVSVGVVSEQPETAIAVQVNLPGASLPASLRDVEIGESAFDNIGRSD